LLSVFTLDPIVDNLRIEGVVGRLERLPGKRAAKPSESSVRQSLARLNALQDKMGASLLEWHSRDETLYIVEPAFLFYLRWRKTRATAPGIFDLISELVPSIQIGEWDGRLEVRQAGE